MPTRRVEDILRVVQEVWGFTPDKTLELWSGSPGNPQRRPLSLDEEIEEEEDVWIRGRPSISKTPTTIKDPHNELSTEP